jgi:Tol biopolymer transport system component
MKKLLLLLFVSSLTNLCFSQNKRKLSPNDVYHYQSISNPQVSPDGKWVLYAVGIPDSSKNKSNTDLFMTSWDGSQTVPVTYYGSGGSNATFSPDGKYISYLSSKAVDSTDNTQLWLMDRRGGEAFQFTKVKEDLESYVWSPDGSKVLLLMKEAEKKDKKSKTKPPIVSNRYHYKQDVTGYTDSLSTHLYVLEMKTGKIDQLTNGIYTEGQASWSPDGSKITFVSNRTADPDRNDNSDIFIIEAKKGSQIKQLTTWKGSDRNPVWSKDGKYIAYLRSTADDTYINYDQNILTIMKPDGSDVKLLTTVMDRPVSNPKWAKGDQRFKHWQN